MQQDNSTEIRVYVFNPPLIATLKPQSNGPSYSNTVIGTLAVDGWAVTFGTARRGLNGCLTSCDVLCWSSCTSSCLSWLSDYAWTYTWVGPITRITTSTVETADRLKIALSFVCTLSVLYPRPAIRTLHVTHTLWFIKLPELMTKHLAVTNSSRSASAASCLQPPFMRHR